MMATVVVVVVVKKGQEQREQELSFFFLLLMATINQLVINSAITKGLARKEEGWIAFDYCL